MPNKQAAIKDLRKNRRQATRNARLKIHVKTLYKKGLGITKDAPKEDVSKAVSAFQQAVDKASKRGVLSKNAASRKKAMLMRSLLKTST